MVDRRAFRTSHPKHARTRLAAVLLCTGLGVTAAPHASAEPQGESASVGSLASQLADSQKQLTELQNQEGGYRQAAVKAIDDLNQATSAADDAQAKVVDARKRLDQSQRDVEAAQKKLNDLSRSQYTQGQQSNAVTMAAGEDAIADTLDRASYLRTEADKQRKVVNQLDDVRTKTANEESSLRKLLADATAKRDDAKNSRDGALNAIQNASKQIQNLQSSIDEAKKRNEELQAQIAAARGQSSSAQQATPAPTTNPTNSANAAEATGESQASQANSASAEQTNTEAANQSSSENADAAQSESKSLDYSAADQTQKERQAAATDAKQKADKALAAAQDAEEKEKQGDPTADELKKQAAQLALIAAEAVKKVEDLTKQLSSTTGAGGPGDAALVGLTSAGLAALAAGLQATTTGADPLAAAQSAGQAVARQAYDAILNSANGNQAQSQSQTQTSASPTQAVDDSSTTSNSGASTATTTSTTSTQSTSTASSPSTTATTTAAASGTSGTSNSGSNSNQSSGSGAAQSQSGTGSNSTSGTTKTTTGELVNGLKNNADALGRVTDGTDAASVATAVGGAATAAATQATSGTTSGSTTQSATTGSAEARINAVIARGMSQLGVRYSWGGGNYYGPTLGIRDGGVADSYGDYANVGFDCSGLVLYAFYIAGFKLPHYTGSQYQSGPQYPASQMKRGDLIFYGPNASQHVAIYLGNGQMLEAPQSGDVVKVSPVRYSGMTPNVVRLIS